MITFPKPTKIAQCHETMFPDPHQRPSADEGSAMRLPSVMLQKCFDLARKPGFAYFAKGSGFESKAIYYMFASY